MREPGLLEFYAKRLRRLLPPYYAALGFFAVAHACLLATHVAQTRNGGGLQELALSLLWHALLLHNLHPDYALSINGPFWTVAVVAQLYILFPLAVYLFRKAGPVWVTPFFLAVSIAPSVACGVLRMGNYAEFADLFKYCVLFRSGEFVAGMMAAYSLARFLREDRLRGAAPRTAICAYPLPVFLLLVPVSVWALKHGGPHGPFSDTLVGVCSALFIYVAGANALPWLRPLLTNRFCRWLGGISYSMYLMHQPFLVFAGIACRRASAVYPGVLGVIWGVCLLWPVALLTGALFQRFIEKPLTRRIREEPYRTATAGSVLSATRA